MTDQKKLNLLIKHYKPVTEDYIAVYYSLSDYIKNFDELKQLIAVLHYYVASFEPDDLELALRVSKEATLLKFLHNVGYGPRILDSIVFISASDLLGCLGLISRTIRTIYAQNRDPEDFAELPKLIQDLFNSPRYSYWIQF